MMAIRSDSGDVAKQSRNTMWCASGTGVRVYCAVLATLVAFCALGCDGQLDIAGVDDSVFPAKPGTETPANNGQQPDVEPVPEASLHRLNRLEYNNSVRDLLGTRLTPADEFPPDASVHGFDNVSSALNITPALMDRYLTAARDVVEDSFADRPAFEARLEEDDPRFAYTINREANSIGGIVRLRGGSADASVEVTTSGAHTIVVRAQGYINGTAAAPRMRVAVAGQNFDFDVPLTMQNTTFNIDLTVGQHPVSIAALNFEENAAENRGNDIMFDFVVVRSDQLVEGPARQLVLTCAPTGEAGDGCPLQVVTGFARRAWRRDLTSDEVARFDSLLQQLIGAGEPTEEAIKLALRGVLTSSKFLYRYRTVEDANSPELVDPFVLASRLSYFIWSTTPDDRLLDAAAAGTLSNAVGIRETVTWMLADPRAQALADGFAEQWLDLRHFEQATPSAEVYPEFNEEVRRAMSMESKLFFLDFLENGQPLSAMLQPDFAYRNAALAGHLGVPGPAGEGFERVPVGAGDRRGVLSLTAWLTSRSDTEHSSPIKRGAWVADNMLCAPVPPPPPGLEIGELMEAESGLSLRERLEMHRNDPTCSGCHASLDVLGMGFEVYDGVARFIDDPALDSVGQIPGTAEEFRGGDAMAAAVAPEKFVSCVSKKLFTYALGRRVTAADIQQVEALGEPALLTLTLPDLLTAIVLSPAFSEPKPLE